MPESSSLSGVFESLSPVARLVAQVFGVVHPYAVTTARAAAILASARLKSGGQRVQNAQAKAAGEELVTAGLAVRSVSGKELEAVKSWAPWLTLEALRNGALDRIMDAFECKQTPYWQYYNDPARKAL